MSLKNLMWSALLGLNLSAAHAQTIDFAKVNQVIAEIGADLIKDDTFFSSLKGEFDAKQTDLSAGSVAGVLGASVQNTRWSTAPTSVDLNASLVKVGEVERQPLSNGQEPSQPVVLVQERIQGTLTLNTAVADMVRYVWVVVDFCAPQQQSWGYYNYLKDKLCPVVDPVLVNLSSVSELIDVIVASVEHAVAFTGEFIVEKRQEMDQTKEEDLRRLIGYEIQNAERAQSILKAVKLESSSSSLSVEVTVDELTFLAQLNEHSLSLGLDVILEIQKETYEYFMSSLENTLRLLEVQDKETIDEAKELLGNYLELVRSIAQPD